MFHWLLGNQLVYIAAYTSMYEANFRSVHPYIYLSIIWQIHHVYTIYFWTNVRVSLTLSSNYPEACDY